MTATTTYPLDRIPRELLQALERNPNDFALRGATADELTVIGEDVWAEALRWSVDRSREFYPERGWGGSASRGSMRMPEPFDMLIPPDDIRYRSNSPHKCFHRLSAGVGSSALKTDVPHCGTGTRRRRDARI